MNATSMALPSLSAVEDCVDFARVVEPYIPQFLALPERVFEDIVKSNWSGLYHLYLETNPLASSLLFAFTISACAFIASETTRNFSQLDRIWALIPNLYTLWFVLWTRATGIDHSRVDKLYCAILVWSLRLTFNYWRRGGYEYGAQDYRWEVVRSRMNAPIWFIFNLTFISTYQNLLLWLCSAVPTYILLLTTKFVPVTSVDYGYVALIIFLVGIETIADNEQWNYHKAKQSKTPTSRYSVASIARGFCTEGLWAYSRHPNFVAEQLIWFFVYQWSCYMANVPMTWAFAGPGLLIMLFQGSTKLTEFITAGKYPEYGHYQSQVAVFVPTSLKGYQPPGPKIIRSSELKNMEGRKTK